MSLPSASVASSTEVCQLLIRQAPAKTRSQALRDLGLVIAEIAEKAAPLSPRAAAERAWHPVHPLTVDEMQGVVAVDRAGVSTRRGLGRRLRWLAWLTSASECSRNARTMTS